MSVNVTFCVMIGDETCTTEEELMSNVEAYRSRLSAREPLEGQITISSSEEPEVLVEDELIPLARNLCFEAITEIAANEHVVIPYFSYYGYLRLDPEGDWVRISGDFVPSVVVPREELLVNLYGCGRRFIEFLRALGEGGSDLSYPLEDLESKAERAEEALEST